MIATDESTVFVMSFFGALVMEDCESNKHFPDPPHTNEGDRFEGFSKSDNPLDR